MTDIYDKASETEELLRGADLQKQLQRANLGAADKWNDLSATHCEAEDCGAPIPEARRKAVPGVQHCIDCQQLRERRTRL